MPLCTIFFPLQPANVAYFRRKIQLSRFSAYLDGLPSQFIRIGEVLLYFIRTLENHIFETISKTQYKIMAIYHRQNT
jgi:hypothetical protein